MLELELEIEQLWERAIECCQEMDLDTAVTCYQRILELRPQRTDVCCELGKVFQQQQQITQAIQAYQRAIALDPRQPDWVYWTLGKALEEQGRDLAAIATYQHGLKLYSPSPNWVYHNLGELLARQKQYDRAISIYRQLIEANPLTVSDTYIKIGDVFQRQNKFFQAKAAYRQARQERTWFNINEVIALVRQSFGVDRDRLKIDILDNGCDPTGRQLALLAEQTTGRVVGTNVCRGFPQGTVQRQRSNNEFYAMDGQNLSFDDYSFDLVISLNVLEHVPNPVKYLQECFRVLRPGGWGFFSWYPLWSGATGHHIHSDMVSRMTQKLELEPFDYRLDGTSIPFWGHLLFSAQEMLDFLVEEKQYDLALAQWMINYTYYGKDLNRWFWRDIWRSFQLLDWNIIEVEHRGVLPLDSSTQARLQRKYGVADDFQISGAKIIVQK